MAGFTFVCQWIENIEVREEGEEDMSLYEYVNDIHFVVTLFVSVLCLGIITSMLNG